MNQFVQEQMMAGAMIYAYGLAKDEENPGTEIPIDKLLDVVYNGLTEVGVDPDVINIVVDIFRAKMESKIS